MSSTPASTRRQQERKRRYVTDSKLGKPCLDCGGVFPPCAMDYDHRPDETKLFVLSKTNERGMAAIRAEMDKCDLICANCHRIRTEDRRVAALLVDHEQDRV